MVKPEPRAASRERAASPGGESKGKGKGKDDGNGKVEKAKLGHCFKFVKGTCTDENCAFMHASAEVVKEFERAQKAKAAKAKAQPKAKAAGASRQVTLNDFMPLGLQSSE